MNQEKIGNADDNHLAKAAMDIGGKPISESTLAEPVIVPPEGPSPAQADRPVKSIKQALGGRKINFHSELPRYEFASLVGHEVVIKGATIVDDWDGQYGTTKFAIMYIELSGGKEGTTLSSGKAIVKQIERLSKGKLFPVSAKLRYESGDTGGLPYYLFDSDEPKPETPVEPFPFMSREERDFQQGRDA